MAACDIHYRFTVRLMRILGLWPYISETTRVIQIILVNIICFLIVIVQITPFIFGEFDMVVLLQSLSVIIMVGGSVVKFNAFIFLASAIRQLMESVKDLWNTTDKDTLEILERRAILGKQQGAIYAIFIYPSAVLMMLYRVASYVMIIATPANTTEVIPFPIVTDYLIDGDKYLFYIVIHQNVAIFFIATTYVATETLFIMWLQHSISLHELVRYHIEKGVLAGPTYISEDLLDTYRRKCLANAVSYHMQAEDFMLCLKTKLSFSYAVLLVFAVVSLSINFFRISIALCQTHNIQEMIMGIFFTGSELVYMFFLNYLVEQAVDYGDCLPTFIYSNPWYDAPVGVQKQLLIIMTKCSERFVFDFYGFYNASIEGFSGLVRCTMSYFMMMTSLQ